MKFLKGCFSIIKIRIHLDSIIIIITFYFGKKLARF
jgi:hypothetical protein